MCRCWRKLAKALQRSAGGALACSGGEVTPRGCPAKIVVRAWARAEGVEHAFAFIPLMCGRHRNSRPDGGKWRPNPLKCGQQTHCDACLQVVSVLGML